jgi:hypothetical protein
VPAPNAWLHAQNARRFGQGRVGWGYEGPAAKVHLARIPGPVLAARDVLPPHATSVPGGGRSNLAQMRPVDMRLPEGIGWAIHDDEAAPLPEQYRKEQQEILAIFARVEFADDHRFYGMNLIDLGTRGFIANPLVEDDPTAQRLRKIGLERRDAHHVMLAIRRECNVFVTCDVRTILKYRPTVEAAFPIRLRRPSELLRDLTL